MNIIELAEKVVGTVLVHGREYFEINDVDGWNRVATAIAKQAVEDYVAGLVQVAFVYRGMTGQISLQGCDGDFFDMSKHIGKTLYAPTPKETK